MKLKKDNVYKITVPIITNEELKRLDNALENDLDKIVQEITEVVSKDREIIILQKVIKKQQKRNKKLKRKLNQIYGMMIKKQMDYIPVTRLDLMTEKLKEKGIYSIDSEEKKEIKYALGILYQLRFKIEGE